MKHILITGAGGTPATNFVRSLRLAKEKFHIIGVDCSKYYLQRAETDERYLVPLANEKDYIPVLNKVIAKTKAEFLHVQNDAEMAVISENRNKLAINMFLPDRDTVKICQDKYASYLLWRSSLPQPKTYLINSPFELKLAMNTIGEVWIRDTHGAGGKGSLKTSDYTTAESWIELKNGWGAFTVSECLTPRSTTFLSIWHNGKLIVAQQRERLYWELNKLAVSGVTGATGTGITVDDYDITEIAVKAIHCIDNKPHGIFSVDLTYDSKGKPNPTEINIGRFFTTHLFFAQAGLNVAYIFVKYGYGEQVKKPGKKINPLPNGLAWVRGMDFEPILTTVKEINKSEKLLEKIRHGK